MEEGLLCGRCCALGYGGLRCIMMPHTMHRVVTFGKPSRRDVMPLVPQVTLQPFDKWVMDFVGPINPPRKRTGLRYIITATDYLTRWEEAAPVLDVIVATATRFIFENILTQFGCPQILMSD